MVVLMLQVERSIGGGMLRDKKEKYISHFYFLFLFIFLLSEMTIIIICFIYFLYFSINTIWGFPINKSEKGGVSSHSLITRVLVQK